MISVRSLPPFWYHWRSQRSDILSSEVKPLWVSVSISVVSDSVLVTVIRCSSEWICGFIICVLLPIGCPLKLFPFLNGYQVNGRSTILEVYCTLIEVRRCTFSNTNFLVDLTAISPSLLLIPYA